MKKLFILFTLFILPTAAFSKEEGAKYLTLAGNVKPGVELSTKVTFFSDTQEGLPLICKSPDYNLYNPGSQGGFNWDAYSSKKEARTTSDVQGHFRLRIPLKVTQLICKFKLYPYLNIEIRDGNDRYSLHLEVRTKPSPSAAWAKEEDITEVSNIVCSRAKKSCRPESANEHVTLIAGEKSLFAPEVHWNIDFVE